jgi:hypothetical protein
MGAKKHSKSKTCIDCSSYLPVPPDELTEFGICLNDEAFDPFVEELLQGLTPSTCKALLEKKRFVGDRLVCPDFQESEIIEIDDDSPFGQALCRLKASGELTPETLEHAIMEPPASVHNQEPLNRCHGSDRNPG